MSLQYALQNVIRSNNTLHFPEFLWISKNHYDLRWTVNRTLRRLKNVIVVMEYEPSIKEEEVSALLVNFFFV
jgi:hypothetical protein